MTLLAVALTLLEPLIELVHVARSAALRVEPLSKVSALREVPLSVRSPFAISVTGAPEVLVCLGILKDKSEPSADAPSFSPESK